MSSISVAGDVSGAISIAAPSAAGSGVLTLPTGTDTLVGKATTDTLTNKSIAATQLTGTIAASVLPAGSVLQVVSAYFTSATSTSSSSFVTTGLTASITPKFSTSKVLILISCGSDNLAANGQAVYTPYRNSTNLSANNGFGVLYSGTARVQGFVSIIHLDSPATSSSTAYTLYFASTNGGSVQFNNSSASGSQTASITLMEIQG